ncbi:MAG: hypothetical protein M5U01_09750 [Ardenticatenaceae bacterium]|nr:hypothetical protein [Ardenticatenaceae bacterium]
MLLLDPEIFSDEFNARVGSNFHALLEIDDHDSLSSFIDDIDNRGYISPIPVPIRHNTFLRADVLFTESLNQVEHAKTRPEANQWVQESLAEGRYQSVIVSSWTRVHHHRYRQRIAPGLFRYRNTIIGMPDFTSPGSPLEKLKPYCNSGILLDFFLDHGVPYPRRHSIERLVKVLLPNEIPVVRSDPDKPLRAAAFAGWAMAQVQSADEFQEFTGQLAAKMGGLPGEH